MALPAGAVWEVRTTGNAANGGFFKPGGTGTDYSQSDTPILSVTDGVANGTTTITSATGGFTSAMVDNGINIGGTVYHITGRTDANTITVDRTVASATGLTMKVGGAATYALAMAQHVGGNTIWLKNGTHGGSQTLQSGANAYTPTSLKGYSTVRGDLYPGSSGTRPVIQHSSPANFAILINGGSYQRYENLDLQANRGSAQYLRGIYNALYFTVRNCKFSGGFNSPVIASWGSNVLEWCEFDLTNQHSTGDTTEVNAHIYLRSGIVHHCHFKGGNGNQISLSQADQNTLSSVFNCTFQDTATGKAGLYSHSAVVAFGNSFYNCGDGIYLPDTSGADLRTTVGQNVLDTISGYGVRAALASSWMESGICRNAFYSVGTQTVNIGTPVASITLTATPFVSGSGGNFTLNETSGGGPNCRNLQVTHPGTATTQYLTLGAVSLPTPTLADVAYAGWVTFTDRTTNA